MSFVFIFLCLGIVIVIADGWKVSVGFEDLVSGLVGEKREGREKRREKIKREK